MRSAATPRVAEAIYVAGITQGNLYDETASLDPATEIKAFLVGYDPDGSRTLVEQFPLGAAVPQPIQKLGLLSRGQKAQPEHWDFMRTWWRKYPVAAFVTTDDRGNVYFAGSSETSLDRQYRNRGKADIFLMRFAPNPEVRK